MGKRKTWKIFLWLLQHSFLAARGSAEKNLQVFKFQKVHLYWEALLRSSWRCFCFWGSSNSPKLVDACKLSSAVSYRKKCISIQGMLLMCKRTNLISSDVFMYKIQTIAAALYFAKECGKYYVTQFVQYPEYTIWLLKQEYICLCIILMPGCFHTSAQNETN